MLLAFGYTSAQVDSTYIGFFESDFSVRAYVLQKFTALSHQVGSNDDTEVDYLPNNPVGIGLGVTYKNISLSGALGFGFMRDKNRGKTSSMDFQYHYYGQKFIYDIFFQKYKGLYTEPKQEQYELYPDIKLEQYGINGQYVFNSKKFSYSAAFNQSQLQLKSAGSILAGGALYYNQARADSSIVFNGGQRLRSYQLGLNGGYAYTWVPNRRLFFSLSMTVGVNFGLEKIDDKASHLKVTPSLFPRFSAGYNHDMWSIGVSAIINRVYILYSEESRMALNSGALQFTFTRRFGRAPKFIENQPLIDTYNRYRFW